jgi:hypothetical protein
MLEYQKPLRLLMRSAYDLQALRIAMGGRVYSAFRSRLGVDEDIPEDSEEDLEEKRRKQAEMILRMLKKEYYLMTEGIATNQRLPSPQRFIGTPVIHNYAEAVLVANFIEMLEREQVMFRDFVKLLDAIPIYQTWLKNVTGCGPTMAAVLLAEFDIERAYNPSKFWAVAGLDVAADGRGRSRRAEHLVKRTYTARDGTEKEKNSITFNPFLKTKIVGVLGTSMLRSRSPYAEIYYGIKHRYEQRALVDPEWSKARIHRASIRYMCKIFLAEFWAAWRTCEGLPLAPIYHEAKLGHVHGAGVPRQALPPPKPKKERVKTQKTPGPKRPRRPKLGKVVLSEAA